jgi:glycosyltransferase involved in cell wall biosynthesis
MKIVIVMPVYEDWDSAIELCRKIDVVISEQNSLRARILLVDDGSAVNTHPGEIPFRPKSLENISVLVLRRNLGHQRAIAIGLAHIQHHLEGDAVVVMDADGEDRPEDIPLLVNAMRTAERPLSVFAERGKRLEKAPFRMFYQCYRILHKVFTGRDIRFGNFSVMPWLHLESLVVFPELWNHYAATIVKSRMPYVRVRADRAVRITGRSRMDFVSLVIHGMSALFANQEVVGTRLLVLDLFIMAGLFAVIATVLGVKLFTDLAIPGWATTVIGMLFILVSQTFIASFMLVFSIMMNRSQLGFLPIRDYSWFVLRDTTLYST